MAKPTLMVLSAAAVAAAVTFFSLGGSGVSAGPLAEPNAAAIKACDQQPWPYNVCVDTDFGKRHVRIIPIDRRPG